LRAQRCDVDSISRIRIERTARVEREGERAGIFAAMLVVVVLQFV